MIYFFNANGTLIKQTPSVVVQGSSESNKIYFVAPLLPTGVVRVGFNLPNGHMTAKYLLTNDGALSPMVDGNGNEYYIWERELPPTVTKQAGEVACQFYYTNAGGQTIATVSVGFTVATGVTTLTPPEDLPEDTYEYIAQILTTISNTKRDKYTPSSNGTYAYTVTKNGDTINDGAIAVDESASGSTIPIRTATGQVNVPETPMANGNASSKKYVDDETAGAISTAEAYADGKFVPKTTEVNGKALSGDITLNASDVDALPESTKYGKVLTGQFIQGVLNIALLDQDGNTLDAPNININASDVGALPNSTKYGASLSLTINSSTFVITAQLLDQDGNTLGSAQTIDLPLESVVVSGSYDSTNKKVILTLQNGSTIEFSVADLVAGLVSSVNGKTGVVVLDKSDIGLGNVANTGDSAIPVENGTTKFTTGGAYTELNKKVDKTTTIAGLSLSANISAQDLTEALNYDTDQNAIDYIMGV